MGASLEVIPQHKALEHPAFFEPLLKLGCKATLGEALASFAFNLRRRHTCSTSVFVSGTQLFFLAVWLDLWTFTFWETADFPLDPQKVNFLRRVQQPSPEVS